MHYAFNRFRSILWIYNLHFIDNCMNKTPENNLSGITKEWCNFRKYETRFIRMRSRRKDLFWSRSSQVWTDRFRHSAQKRNDFCSRRKDFFLCNALHKLEMLTADSLHRFASAGSNLHGAFRALALIEFLHMPAANETCSNLLDLPYRSVFRPRFKVLRKGGRILPDARTCRDAWKANLTWVSAFLGGGGGLRCEKVSLKERILTLSRDAPTRIFQWRILSS